MTNVGHVDDVTDLTLASATSAIITARWNGAAQRRRAEHDPSPGRPLPSRGSSSVPPSAADHNGGPEHTAASIFGAAQFAPVPEVFASNGGLDGHQPHGSPAPHEAPPSYGAQSPYEPAPPAYEPAQSYEPAPPAYEPAQSYEPARSYEPPPFEAPPYEAPPPAYEPPPPRHEPARSYEPPPFEPPPYGASPQVSTLPMREPGAFDPRGDFETVPGVPATDQEPNGHGYSDGFTLVPGPEPAAGIVAPLMTAPPMSAPPMSAPPMSAAAMPGAPASQSPVPPAAFVPGQRAGEPDDAADFGFAGSIMADLTFPEPFVVEPYEPGSVVNGGELPVRNGTAVAARRPAGADPLEINTEPMLPQRVPGVPDVPDVPLRPNDPLLDPTATPIADGVELSRIATYLRDDTVNDPDERPDGFDLAAVLTAVQGVNGVRDANLRWNTGFGHTLRIEFDEGADEGKVTREVARLLRETLGLSAAPSSMGGPTQGYPGGPGTPAAVGTARASVVASASVPVRPGPRPAPAEPHRRGAHPLPPRDGAVSTGPRVVLDHVQVTTLGVDATIEVRLQVSGGTANGHTQSVGRGQGPAVDAYLLRLAAGAAGDAIDQLLIDPQSQTPRGRCFVEHVAVVPFAGVDVAVVVLLLVWGSSAEQHSGTAIVAGDPREAVVRATLSAVNRRLQSLLA